MSELFDMEPDTIPTSTTEPTETETAVGTPTTDTEPLEGDNTQGAGDSTPVEEGAGEPTGLTVQFNHEERALSRDEAVQYAQKGLKFDAVEGELSALGVKIGDIPGIMGKLDYLAAMRGATTAAEMLDSMIGSIDRQERARLESQYDDDEVVEVMLKDFQEKNKARYEQHTGARSQAAAQEKDTREAKIAAQFTELQKEFPDVEKYADLPKEVIRAAAEGQDLMTAYLLHQHRHTKAAQKQQQVEQQNRQSGTGAVASDGPDGGEDAFLRGLLGVRP